MRSARVLGCALLLGACSVDYKVDQRKYDELACLRDPNTCSVFETRDSGAGGRASSEAGAQTGGGGSGSASSGGRTASGGRSAGGLTGSGGGSTDAGMGGAADSAAVDASSCTSGDTLCADSTTLRECIGGVPVDTPCTDPTPVCESGACVVCAAASARCNAGIPEQCLLGAWQPQTACTAGTFCQAGVCVSPQSCSGLPSTCGATGDESCCASLLVPGGTYYRNNDGTLTATVSDFLLDKYEITVGRFRAFVAAYPGDLPATAGVGAHPAIKGSGWDTSWNSTLPVTQGLLAANLATCGSYATWTSTAGTNENKPINCLNWYLAFAFCAWDGGRLPTDAEWDYAATGGIDQRIYPWGDTAPGSDNSLAVFGCYYGTASPGSCTTGSGNIANVGSIPLGNGKWGHADLGGNIEEWVLDWSTGVYPTPCLDCAVTTGGSSRAARGGYFSAQSTYLQNSVRDSSAPSNSGSTYGVRCARDP